jgi:uncharacterized protein YjbI with pentapeptide repeats
MKMVRHSNEQPAVCRESYCGRKDILPACSVNLGGKEGAVPAIIKPSRLASMIQTEAVAGGGLTTVSAFALFDFADPYRLLTEQALWPMVVEQMPKGAVFDKGKLKPRAELIVAGAALAPTDRPVTGRRVTARLGRLGKRLAVFGDRFWRLTDRGFEMTEAVPFDRMPVDEAHAFGGPNHKANPRGKGHGARAIAEAGYDAPLPNVEDAGRLIRLVDDNPAPAHFGPLAPDDAGRMRYAGTYDQNWIRNVAPLKPDDFNPLFYCDAPADQRLDSYIEGNEDFMVSGMSRGEAAVGGRLPALRARTFVHRPADGSFTEIRMVCDTVTLFPNVTKAVLAFRGIAKGEDRFGEDIGAVMFALERGEDAPRPQDYYLHVFRLRTNPDEAHKHALSDFQLMPEIDPETVSARRRQKLEKARQDRIRYMENLRWGAQKAVEDAGLPPETVPSFEDSPADDLPLVAMPTSEEIERGDLDLAELLDDVKALETAIRGKADEELAKAELQRRRLALALPPGLLSPAVRDPIVDDDHMARFPGLAFGSEVEDALAMLDDALPSKDAVLGAFDAGFAGEGFASLPAEIDRVFDGLGNVGTADPEAAENQFRLACARALGLPEGSLFHDIRNAFGALPAGGPDDRFSADDPDRQEFAALFDSIRDSKFEQRDPADLDREALFRELPFEADRGPAEEALRKTADKIRTVAPGLIAKGSEDNPVAGLIAKLATIGRPAEPDETDVTIGERFDRSKDSALGQIDEAEPEVEATVASARRMTPMAIFPTEPLLAGVAERFGAFVREKLAAGHDFKGADLAGADLGDVDFSGRDLAGTFFEKTNLAGANLSGADLSGCAFTEAVLDGADFTGARLDKANLSRASLRGTVLDKCRLDDVTVIEADFTGASALGAAMARSTFINCRLDGADFSGSRIADLQLLQGQADGIRMDDAEIERAMFMVLSMKQSSFAGSRLERTVFTQITAPGAFFAEARLKTVSFVGECDLGGSSFARIRAEEASWNTTRLVESNFLRARCHGCLFNTCDVSASDFRLASLRNSRFLKSTLADSDLFGANLFAASLAMSDLRRTSLRGANLYFADLLEAKLASCDLSGANLGRTLMEQPAHA